MNLLAVRKKVVQTAGRYDLVVDSVDYVDNGMDFFINAGMNMLDRLVNIPESFARLYYTLSSGEYSLAFKFNCRYITDVWINDDEERFQIEKISLDILRDYYNEPATSTTYGTPTAFAIANLRALETTDKDSLATFIDKTWAEDDTKYDYRGIILSPPADKDYIVEISGMFKQVPLAVDADENYWTIQESDLLVRAALYKLEAFSRGTENAKNWLSAIYEDIRQIDLDIAAEESHGINQLNG